MQRNLKNNDLLAINFLKPLYKVVQGQLYFEGQITAN